MLTSTLQTSPRGNGHTELDADVTKRTLLGTARHTK